MTSSATKQSLSPLVTTCSGGTIAFYVCCSGPAEDQAEAKENSRREWYNFSQGRRLRRACNPLRRRPLSCTRRLPSGLVKPLRAARINEQQERAMRPVSLAFALLGLCFLVTEPAFAAIKFKRFPHCPEGTVSVKTCECHAGTSGRYQFCHAGNSCDPNRGKCHK